MLFARSERAAQLLLVFVVELVQSNKVFDSLDSELCSGIYQKGQRDEGTETLTFVADDDGLRMSLQSAESPHVVDTFLNTFVQGERLVCSSHNEERLTALAFGDDASPYLLGIHDGTDAHCKDQNDDNTI